MKFFRSLFGRKKIKVTESYHDEAEETSVAKPPPIPLVVLYDKLLSTIHDDKVRNRPGVYVYFSRTSFTSERFWELTGFLLGKNAVTVTHNGVISVQHILQVLHYATSFAVCRVGMVPERTGILLTNLMDIKEKGDLVLEQDAAGFVYDQCRKALTGTSEFQDKTEYDIVEPDELYSKMKVIFEHRGE